MESLTEAFELGGLLTAANARSEAADEASLKAMQRSVSLEKYHFIPALLSKHARLRSTEKMEVVNRAYDRYSPRYKNEQTRILAIDPIAQKTLQPTFMELRAKERRE